MFYITQADPPPPEQKKRSPYISLVHKVTQAWFPLSVNSSSKSTQLLLWTPDLNLFYGTIISQGFFRSKFFLFRKPKRKGLWPGFPYCECQKQFFTYILKNNKMDIKLLKEPSKIIFHWPLNLNSDTTLCSRKHAHMRSLSRKMMTYNCVRGRAWVRSQENHGKFPKSAHRRFYCACYTGFYSSGLSPARMSLAYSPSEVIKKTMTL